MKLSLNIINIIIKYVGLNTNIDYQCPILENFLKEKDINYNKLMNNQYLPLSYIKKNEYKIDWLNFEWKVPLNILNKNLMNLMKTI